MAQGSIGSYARFAPQSGGEVPDFGRRSLPKKHTLVFDTGAKIPAEAAFLECQERSGAVPTPELFPRADGTTYVRAISSEEPLPVDPARVAPDPGAIARLEAMCSSMSPVLASAKILAR
jgi:hypothetical protein